MSIIKPRTPGVAPVNHKKMLPYTTEESAAAYRAKLIASGQVVPDASGERYDYFNPPAMTAEMVRRLRERLIKAGILVPKG